MKLGERTILQLKFDAIQRLLHHRKIEQNDRDRLKS